MDITEQIQKKAVKTSFKIELEKLDGGFVSNVTGKRAIYKYASDITEHVNIENQLENLKDDEYVLNIDIITKADMEDYVDLASQIASNSSTEPVEMSYEEAKAKGIIQEADKFNPHPVSLERTVPETDIKVNEHTAYKAGRLKQIDWKAYDKGLELSNLERVEISGMSSQAMYNQWRKAKEGKASFHLVQTRIGFTILAKYYEAHLGVRSSTKDQMDKLKADVLASLRELELMASTIKFVKSTEVNKKIAQIRKQLL